MRSRALSLLLLASLGACAMRPLPPGAALPSGAIQGGGDPMRSAILSSAYVFGGSGEALPQERARAAALVEFMAADYRWNPRWGEFTPVIGGQLDASRAELRQALAVSPDASPQEVVTGLYGLSRAMAAGDATASRAALQPAIFVRPETTLRALAAPGQLPATRIATSMAERELHRIDNQSHFSGGGESGAHP